MRRLGRLIALTAVAATVLLGAASPPPDSVPLDLPKAHLYVRETDETAMLSAVNALRAAAGIPRLAEDARLTRVAREYAREMLSHGYFGHRGPEGTTPASRLQAAGYAFRTMGENIAFAQVEKVAQAGLEASPEHRHNMLERAFTRAGVGVIADSVYGSAFVQEFAGD